MQEWPLVSVLLPSYNYANFIGEAIESVLAQTYINFELIIVDNQSTDNTEDIIKKYLTDQRVYYYKNSVNIGLSRNFNRSIEYAKGEYIKFLMADDKFHPALLEKFVAAMQAYPQVSLVTSYSQVFGDKTKVRTLPFTGLQGGKKVVLETLREGQWNWIGEPTTVMFRSNAVHTSGNFNSNFYYVVDWEMWTRILLAGDCYVIPEVLSYFRVHENQISERTIKYYASTFEDYWFYKQVQTNYGSLLDLSAINIHKQIKQKATYCGDVMFKLITSLHKKKNRELFIKSFIIARREKVLSQSIAKLLTAARKKMFSSD